MRRKDIFYQIIFIRHIALCIIILVPIKDIFLVLNKYYKLRNLKTCFGAVFTVNLCLYYSYLSY